MVLKGVARVSTDKRATSLVKPQPPLETPTKAGKTKGMTSNPKVQIWGETISCHMRLPLLLCSVLFCFLISFLCLKFFFVSVISFFWILLRAFCLCIRSYFFEQKKSNNFKIKGLSHKSYCRVVNMIWQSPTKPHSTMKWYLYFK